MHDFEGKRFVCVYNFVCVALFVVCNVSLIIHIVSMCISQVDDLVVVV